MLPAHCWSAGSPAPGPASPGPMLGAILTWALQATVAKGPRVWGTSHWLFRWSLGRDTHPFGSYVTGQSKPCGCI